MSVHTCPSCGLGFRWRTVLEYHLRNDHPDVRFEYPQQRPADADWPMAQRPKRYTWRPTYPTRHIP
jgi:hypothetical protein